MEEGPGHEEQRTSLQPRNETLQEIRYDVPSGSAHPLPHHIVIAVLKDLLGRLIPLEGNETKASGLVIVWVAHHKNLMDRDSEVSCTTRCRESIDNYAHLYDWTELLKKAADNSCEARRRSERK